MAIAAAAMAPAAQAGWLPPVAISESGEHAGGPHVVLDSAGNATAVWDRWNGTDTVVESAYRAAGEKWGAPVDLSEPEIAGEVVPGANDAQAPQIAVDGKGNVTVLWERYADTKTLLQSVDRPAGGSWTEPETIGEVNQGFAPEPWIAVDQAGNASAIWKRGEVIQSAYRPAGGAWEAATPISPPESFVPQAAVDAGGDTTAVWMHFNGSRYVVESAYRPAGGDWEAPTLVSAPGEWAGNPHVAIDADGVTLVVWRGEDDGEEFVRAADRPVGGSWAEPEDVSVAGEQVEALRDAVDPQGNAIVAWAGSGTEIGGHQIARAAFKPAGGDWQEPTDLSVTGGNSFPSHVVFDSSGNAAVIWQRWDGVSNLVQAAYRSVGGGWEPSVDLSEEGRQGMDSVVVLDAPGDATAADGDATAIWVDATTIPCAPGKESPCFTYSVQAAGYDPDGVPVVAVEAASVGTVGEPVEVSTPTAGLYAPLIEFGDGASASASQASHVYDEPGEYEVTVGGAEELGYRSSATRTITISAADGSGGSVGGGPTPGGSGGAGSSGAESSPVVPAPPLSLCPAAEAGRDAALRSLRAIAAKLQRAHGAPSARRLAAAKRRQARALAAARRRAAAVC